MTGHSEARKEKISEMRDRLDAPRRFWLSDREALMGIVFVLLLIGTLNIYSSSFIIGLVDYKSTFFFLRKHGINLLPALAIFFFMLRKDYRKLRGAIVPVTLVTIVLLVLVFIVGDEINGARRWIWLGFFTMQPSEIAKLIAIFIAAAYISHNTVNGKPLTLANLQNVIIIIFFILVEREPDGATAAIIVGTPIMLYFCSQVPAYQKKRLILGVLAGTALIFWWQPYRLMRLRSAFDPWADPENAGYQVVQSLSAIGSGGLWGMGIGKGISKYFYLPEAHTDFAFAVWCQETGFIGALVVFALFTAFAYYGIRIANRAVDAFGHFLAAGITFLIVGQAIANMLMVAGLFPVVGVPLPFISYGGTSLLVTMASVGILANISIIADRMGQPDNVREKKLPPTDAKKPKLRLVYSRN